MDEDSPASKTPAEANALPASNPSSSTAAAEKVAPTEVKAPPPPLNLNELQETYSNERLDSLARQLALRLHPGRTRHHLIVDIVRAALSLGGTVTAEGFLDEVGDSFGILRSPRLNFLPVP